MRVFIGSSSEQRRLVEWLTAFIIREYRGKLQAVPWTEPWPGGRYTLENLLAFVEDTDAAILFWTADDKTWYRDAQRTEPRDNLVFEAGLYIAAHGRERTQLMVPAYGQNDRRGAVAVPSDVAGMTWNQYAWDDGPPERTGLPNTARVVCDRLIGLGPRPRKPALITALAAHEGVDELHTVVGDWFTVNLHGIQRLARADTATTIDILAAYRVGEIARALDLFRKKPQATLRACFANMFDDPLIAAYQRKYYNRTPEYIRHALEDSFHQLLGPCTVVVRGDSDIVVTATGDAPAASYTIRLTAQRVTYGYYRIDDASFIVPLDMKKAQNPSPPAWVVLRETAPKTFDRYQAEFNAMFEEAVHVYPGQ